MRARRVLALSVSLAMLGIAPAASADHFRLQPGSNDAFADRVPLTLDAPVWANTWAATPDAGEPASSCDATADDNSVWFSFTAPAAGDYVIDTYPSDDAGPEFHGVEFNTAITVFTGATLGALVEDSCDSGATSDNRREAPHTSRVGVTAAAAGDTFVVRVAPQEAAIPGVAPVTVRTVTDPANDDFADALAIPAEGGTATGWFGDAGLEGAEPDFSCVTETGSVWFTHTPAETGDYLLRTVDSDRRTALAVHTGNTLAGLTEVDCRNDDTGPWTGGNDSGALWTGELTAGTTYRIALATEGASFAEAGRFALDVIPVEVPANDDIADAVDVLDLLPYEDTMALSLSTKQAGETCGEDNSVWYRVTAPGEGLLHVDTLDSDGDLELYIATGPANATAYGDLTEIICNDFDSSFTYADLWTVPTTAGTTYFISLMDHAESGRGHIQIDWTTETPANDELLGATLVDTLPFVAAGTTVGATTDATNCESTYPEIWYQWTAPADMTAYATTDGSRGDTWLAVYDDVDVTNVANELVCVDDQSAVYHAGDTWDAQAGSTYWIAVGGLDADSGNDAETLLSLVAGGSVSGTVTQAVGNVPLEGICVSVFDGDDLIATTTTDADGRYLISGLVGEYDVVVNDDCDALHPSYGSSTESVTTADTTTVVSDHALEGVSVRYQGPTRIETAIAISNGSFPTLPGGGTDADAVVLARSDAYPDALAGGPLARAANAPILLSSPSGLPDAVKAEITRLGVTSAYLLGGEAALSAQVQADLLTLGVTTVERLGGADRFFTAALVADELAEVLGRPLDGAYVVEGINADPNRGWPDAVSAGAAAARQGQPILLVRSTMIPTGTADAIDDNAITAATIVGGPAAVSADVESDLAALVGGAAAVTRLSGPDRFGTSAAVAEAEIADIGTGFLWIATGLAFPDALAAGPAAAAGPDILLLVHGQDPTRGTASTDWITANKDSLVAVRTVGGVAAVSAAVEQAVKDILAG